MAYPPWPEQLVGVFLLLIICDVACSGYGGDAIASYNLLAALFSANLRRINQLISAKLAVMTDKS